MQPYKVYFTRITEICVEVTADDPDTALELAYDECPSDPCAQCSGHGTNWSRTELDETQFEHMDDESGAEVMSDGDRWTRVATAFPTRRP